MGGIALLKAAFQSPLTVVKLVDLSRKITDPMGKTL
jgi:hypothetical protein